MSSDGQAVYSSIDFGGLHSFHLGNYSSLHFVAFISNEIFVQLISGHMIGKKDSLDRTCNVFFSIRTVMVPSTVSKTPSGDGVPHASYSQGIPHIASNFQLTTRATPALLLPSIFQVVKVILACMNKGDEEG
jgi:hypothetical protein